MNRYSNIRHLACALALTAVSAFGVGCAGQVDPGTSSQEADLDRKAHLVGYSPDQGETPVVVEHQLATGHSPIHPATGANLGPRPEPWMDKDGDSNGPRPEPWHSDDDPNGTPSSSSSGGTGSSSSGGNPNPVK